MPAAWKPAIAEVRNGGMLEGDPRQAVPAYSLRFIHDAHPDAVLDLHVYPTRLGERYGVTVRADFIICGSRDEPEATAQWAGMALYDRPGGYGSLANAEGIAWHLAGKYARGRPPPQWDARPWHQEQGRPALPH
jgi:hypothetical protein